MKHNPCLVCRMRDEDKNNSLCIQCDKRIGYLQHLDQELDFSLSYTSTRLYTRVSYPMETNLPGRLKMAYGR